MLPAMSNLGWYLRRVARMSPREILHRAGEYLRKRRDRHRRYGWGAFGAFDGPIQGLPALDALLARREQHRSEADQSAIRLLNQAWPAADGERSLWLLDPVTGACWPGAERFTFDISYRHAAGKGDVKFVWELNRLQLLQRAALEAGGDSAKWERILALLESWMADNPPFQGINWNSGIEAASRVISLLVLLSLASGAQRGRLETIARPFLDAHAYWIHRYPSLFSSANNHHVAELTALFLAGLCAPDLPRAEAYRAEGRRGLEAEILRQFHPDGVGAEQSVAYASYCLEWFVVAGMAADASGQCFSQAYRARARAAAEHLAWLQDDAGHAPHIGDDDEARILNLYPDGEPYIRSVCRLACDWLGITPSPAAGLKTFAEGGYTVIREPGPRGTLLAVFDHAPLGYLSIAAHGHADALSLWLHWGDEAILVDAGTYLYHSGGGTRDYFRSTAAHNTLAIDGKNQSTIAGAFNWSRHAQTSLLDKTGESVTAECDGYVRLGIRHRRSLSWRQPGTLIVEDRLTGRGLAESHAWEAGFLLAPGVEATLEDDIARLTTPAGRKLQLALSPHHVWQKTTAPFSHRFNMLTNTTRLTVQGRTSARDGAAPLLILHISLIA